MNNEVRDLAKVFSIFSNEVRLCILLNLYENNEKNVTSLQKCANVSQSMVSQQLAKLKDNKVIVSTKRGNEVFYTIVDQDIIDFIKYIKKDKH